MQVKIMNKIEDDMREVVRLVDTGNVPVFRIAMSHNDIYHIGYKMSVSGYDIFRNSRSIPQGNFLYGS